MRDVYKGYRYLSSVVVTMLLAGCGGSMVDENATDTTANNSLDALQYQQRAVAILQSLQQNVAQDIPENIRRQEEVVSRITTEVILPLEGALLRLDTTEMEKLFSTQAKVDGLRTLEQSTIVRRVADITEYTAEPVEGLGWKEFIASFTEAEYAKLELHDILSMNETDVTCRMFLDVRGLSQGLLRQDRGWVTVTFHTDISSGWQISQLEMTTQDILTTPKASFVDVTEKSGLSTVPLFPRLEALRRGGYAITAGDIDSDNDVDIYVGGWGESKLYINDGSGKFTDATQTASLHGVDRVKAAAMADLDNDGDKDLLVSRFIDDKAEDVLVYINEGEVGGAKFTMNDHAVQKALQYDRAMPLTVADFNNDAKLDVYVGFPGARDFTYLDAKPSTLNTHGLFLNSGDTDSIQFTDSTIASGLDVAPMQRVGLAAYPHASVKADFDGDGKVDLMIADDRRGVSQVFKNDGSAKFAEVSSQAQLYNHGWAMGVAVGDYDNDGLPDIYYSNIDFLAAKRISAALGNADIQTFHGNRLYRNLGNGKFADVTETAGVGWAGEATAGSSWVDYDNDGDLDLLVLNGLWTGPGDQDLSSLFNQAYVAELLIEQTDKAKALADIAPDAISLRNPGFNNMIIQILTHYTGDLDSIGVDAGNDVPSLSLGGNQRNMVFRNNGDGTFTEVGYALGLDSIDDGYMPAIADVNGDGKVDIFVRNCDPGTDAYQYPSLRLFENQGTTVGNALHISLRGDGVSSNKDAVGAKITVEVEGRMMVREIDTVAGAAQSQMMAFFGLGEATKADTVTIQYPSGVTQVYKDVPMGTQLYTEIAQ